MSASLPVFSSGLEVVVVIESLPDVVSFYFGFLKDYWDAASSSDVLAGFLALGVVSLILKIFDII